VGESVGSGKTTLVETLCKAIREKCNLVMVIDDTYTKKNQRLLTVFGALEANRIMGAETGGCSHAAIREDASINLKTVDRMLETFPNIGIVSIESGNDNLAATFSPELSDPLVHEHPIERSSGHASLGSNTASAKPSITRCEPHLPGSLFPTVRCALVSCSQQFVVHKFLSVIHLQSEDIP